MKKFVIGFLCFFAFMSCEIPESITIKGHPGLYIPLGSPFPKENGLDVQITSKILESMGVFGDNLYDYRNESKADGVEKDVQAFVVRYPIINEWKIVNDVDFAVDPEIGNYPPNLLPKGLSYLLEDEYVIRNSLGSFLGKDVEYINVTAYLYMTGIDNATLSLDVGSTNVIEDKPLTQKLFPPSTLGKFTGTLSSTQSLTTPIDLTEFFKSMAEDNEAFTLKYGIEIPLNPANIGKSISADLVILLPMEFQVRTESSDPGYVKLSLGDIFPESTGGDIFGRKDSDDDDLLNNIDMVRITLKNYKNNIMGGSPRAIKVSSDSDIEFEEGEPFFDFGIKDPSLTVKPDKLPNPFIPRFEYLLKKETGKDYATLKFLRQAPDSTPIFDFFMAVEARAEIDHTTKF
jgi:hypothetical protein